MSARVELVVGLGNPGKDYANTRHNAGFWFVLAFAQSHKTAFHTEKKFSGELARSKWHDHDVFLLKPMTYMNLSGQSVQAVMQFYKIELPNVLVVHDDLDLPTGTAKLKVGGGHGGHNGLRDIIEKCGGNDFMRIRLGIGHPGDRSKVTDHVLNKISQADDAAIRNAITASLDIMPLVMNGEIQKAMNKLHSTAVASS